MNTLTTKKMSDTPRTKEASVDKGGMTFVWVEFAEQLERELAVSLENQLKAMQENERLKMRVELAADWLEYMGRSKSSATLRSELAPTPRTDALSAKITRDGIKMLQDENDFLEAEVEILREQLARAIEIADTMDQSIDKMFYAGGRVKLPTFKKLNDLKAEIRI